MKNKYKLFTTLFRVGILLVLVFIFATAWIGGITPQTSLLAYLKYMFASVSIVLIGSILLVLVWGDAKEKPWELLGLSLFFFGVAAFFICISFGAWEFLDPANQIGPLLQGSFIVVSVLYAAVAHERISSLFEAEITTLIFWRMNYLDSPNEDEEESLDDDL